MNTQLGRRFRQFPRGARPSPRYKLLRACAFVPPARVPTQLAYVPQRLDFWDNSKYGDCVTAEEGFAKACYLPEIFIDPALLVSWAEAHGFLNGADLVSVLDSMQSDGFQVGTQRYNDGPYFGVDYSDESILQAAIAQGPVKIAIDADALPAGAGNENGWYAIGGGKFPNTDHCVSVCGYGSAEYLYSQLGLPLPVALPGNKTGYLVFTWSTIGFVDHDWIMGTCEEAWVRNPTTVGVPPLPGPGPTPPPPPPVPPSPVPWFQCIIQFGLALVNKVDIVTAITQLVACLRANGMANRRQIASMVDALEQEIVRTQH